MNDWKNPGDRAQLLCRHVGDQEFQNNSAPDIATLAYSENCCVTLPDVTLYVSCVQHCYSLK